MVSSLRPSFLHAPFWVLPLAASVAWLGLLLGLLLWWIVDDDHKRYKSNETSVVFISDIGAAHTTLMIAGTAVVWTFYTASLLAERYLRAIGRLPTSGRRSEAVVGWIVVALGFLGGAALCLLSIFNAFKYGTAHWSLTYTFGGCCLGSAVLQTGELYRLAKWLGRLPAARASSPLAMTAAQEDAALRTRRALRRVAHWKSAMLGTCLLGGVGFAATYGLENSLCNNADDFAGVGSHGARCNFDGSFSAACEWLIAFLIVGYLITLIFDLLPARQTYGLTTASVLRHKGDRDLLPTSVPGPGSPETQSQSEQEHSPIMRETSSEFITPVGGLDHAHAYAYAYAEPAPAPEPVPAAYGYGQPAHVHPGYAQQEAYGRLPVEQGYGQGYSQEANRLSRGEMSVLSSVYSSPSQAAGSDRWTNRHRAQGYAYP